jgi:hypothetical protein
MRSGVSGDSSQASHRLKALLPSLAVPLSIRGNRARPSWCRCMNPTIQTPNHPNDGPIDRKESQNNGKHLKDTRRLGDPRWVGSVPFGRWGRALASRSARRCVDLAPVWWRWVSRFLWRAARGKSCAQELSSRGAPVGCRSGGSGTWVMMTAVTFVIT